MNVKLADKVNSYMAKDLLRWQVPKGSVPLVQGVWASHIVDFASTARVRGSHRFALLSLAVSSDKQVHAIHNKIL